MRIYLETSKVNIKEYTIRLLRRLIGPWLVDNPSEADVVAVSLCDITELSTLIRAKRHGKPVLAGGMISEYPILNELADYVWHGEAYDLRDLLEQGAQLDEMPYITTRLKRQLRISSRICWSENPIVRIGRRAQYYYAAKGCSIRCKYCLMAYTRERSQAPESMYLAALKGAEERVTIIAPYCPYRVPKRANVAEVLLRHYASNGDVYAGPRTIRTSMELCTPHLSKALAKGTSEQDLHAALEVSKANKQALIVYFLAGIEPQEVVEDMLSRLPIDAATEPKVTLVWTYIDPQPLTPFYRFNIEHKLQHPLDTMRLYLAASSRNKRVRIHPLARMRHSTIRTLLGRVTSSAEHAVIARLTHLQHPDELMAALLRAGLERLIGDESLDDVLSAPREVRYGEYWEAPQAVPVGCIDAQGVPRERVYRERDCGDYRPMHP